MEKGTIKSFDKGSGTGYISRALGTDVRFYADGTVGNQRSSMAPGDAVWFEVDNIKSSHVAINVRKCN